MNERAARVPPFCFAAKRDRKKLMANVGQETKRLI